MRARRGVRVAAAVATLVGCCLAGGPAAADPGFDFQRIGGPDRFDTSALVAQTFGDSVDVVLANGQDGRYVDALAASYLAGSLQAPILLTRKQVVPGRVAGRLEQSGAQHVWVVGGPAAVSAGEVANLRDEGYDVTRVAGSNRYLTDAAVIEAGGSSADGLGLVATGTDFADALAGSPLAYRGLPLGLADGDSISEPVIAALKDAGVSRVLIIGGAAAVGSDVPAELEAQGISVADRLQGAPGTGRAATSVAVADYAVAHLGFTDQGVNVASGYADGYGADALAGGPLTGSESRPLLVTTDVDDPSAEVLDYLDGHAGTLHTGIIFGGTGAVGSDAAATMTAAATTAPAAPSTPPPPAKDPLLSEKAVAYTDTWIPNVDVWGIAFDHDLAPGLVTNGQLAEGVSIILEDQDGQQIVLDHDNTGPAPAIKVALGDATSSSRGSASPAGLVISFPTGEGPGPAYPLRVVSATGLHGADTGGWDVTDSPDSTLEPAPAAPDFSLEPLSTSSVAVTIPDDNTVDGYRIYRKTGGLTSDGDVALVKALSEDTDTDANVYVDTGLSRETSYGYYVTAVRDGVQSFFPIVPTPVTTLSAPAVAGVATVQPGQLASTNVDDLGEPTSLRFTAVDVGGPEISVFTLPDLTVGSLDFPKCAAFQISPSQVEINIEYAVGANAKDVADLTNGTAACTAWVTASTDAPEAAAPGWVTYVLRNKFGQRWSAAGQDIKLSIDWGEEVTGVAASSAFDLNGNPAATAVASDGTTTLTWTEGQPVADGDLLTIPADAVEVADGTGNAQACFTYAQDVDGTGGAWGATACS